MMETLEGWTRAQYHRGGRPAPVTFRRAGLFVCTVHGVTRRRVLWQHPDTRRLYYHPQGAAWLMLSESVETRVSK